MSVKRTAHRHGLRAGAAARLRSFHPDDRRSERLQRFPPAGRPLPPLRPWRQTVPALSRAHEALISEKLESQPGQHERQAPDFVADVFQGMENFVCTIDAFDPYRAYRRTGSVSPPSTCRTSSRAHRYPREVECSLPTFKRPSSP